MDEKLREAVTLLEEHLKGHKEVEALGFIPPVLSNSYAPIVAAITMLCNYVRDTEDLKKI